MIDGTLIPIDRVAADRPFYSGKHCNHGMNLQVIASPDGDIIWVSGPLPGAVHDLTAARVRASCGSWPTAGWWCWRTTRARQRGEHIRTPYRGRNKPASQKAANHAHARLRSPRERAKCPAQIVADTAQAPLLPPARRATRQVTGAANLRESHMQSRGASAATGLPNARST